MILTIRTDSYGLTVTQIRLLRTAQVQCDQGCTVCHSFCIFWPHKCMVKPQCSKFRIITAFFLRIRIFWILTVLPYFQMFHSVMCNDVTTLPRLHLSSMVCYYGKHYSTFVWHTKLNSWVYFDDATVKEVCIPLHPYLPNSSLSIGQVHFQFQGCLMYFFILFHFLCKQTM